MEDISFEADASSGNKITITADDVTNKLSTLVEDVDHARYIL